jgi:hypothetical protein
MTPIQEKAQELIHKFYWAESDHSTSIIDAKKFAKIAVDETIIALEENQWQNRNQIAYYKEVKQEMQKL